MIRTRHPFEGWRVRFVSWLAPLALLSLSSTVAHVAELSLAWGDCRAGGGAPSIPYECDSNVGSRDLFAGFVLDAAIDGAIGLVAVLDVQSASTMLPDWWAFAVGGCRVGELDAIAGFADRPGCANPWSDAPSGAVALIQGVDPGRPRGGANQMRVFYAAVISSSTPVDLSSGESYHGARLRISNARTVGAGSCSGCATPVCLVLNSIEIQRVSGPDVVLSNASPGQNIANWQGSGLDCSAVHVRTTSWGRLRSMYR